MILYKHKKNRDTAITIINEYYEDGIKKAHVAIYNIRPEYFENGKPFLIGYDIIRLQPRSKYERLEF